LLPNNQKPGAETAAQTADETESKEEPRKDSTSIRCCFYALKKNIKKITLPFYNVKKIKVGVRS